MPIGFIAVFATQPVGPGHSWRDGAGRRKAFGGLGLAPDLQFGQLEAKLAGLRLAQSRGLDLDEPAFRLAEIKRLGFGQALLTSPLDDNSPRLAFAAHLDGKILGKPLSFVRRMKHDALDGAVGPQVHRGPFRIQAMIGVRGKRPAAPATFAGLTVGQPGRAPVARLKGREHFAGLAAGEVDVLGKYAASGQREHAAKDRSCRGIAHAYLLLWTERWFCLKGELVHPRQLPSSGRGATKQFR